MPMLAWYGAVVSVAFSTPSTQNSTFATPALSEAAADTAIVGPVSESTVSETLGSVTSIQARLADLSVSSVTLHVELVPLHAPPQDGAKPVGPPEAVRV